MHTYRRICAHTYMQGVGDIIALPIEVASEHKCPCSVF